MGTWGVAIFSDDTAADVREDWRDAILEGLSPEAATDRLVESYHAGPDDTVFWLGLAAAQAETGRLIDRVRDRAAGIIDEGRDLARWQEEASEADARARQRVLLRLREKLLGPQPPPKRLRRAKADRDPGIGPNTADWNKEYAALRWKDLDATRRLRCGAGIIRSLGEKANAYADGLTVAIDAGCVLITAGTQEWRIPAEGDWTYASYALAVMTAFQEAASQALGAPWPEDGAEPHAEHRKHAVICWFGDEQTATVRTFAFLGAT